MSKNYEKQMLCSYFEKKSTENNIFPLISGLGCLRGVHERREQPDPPGERQGEAGGPRPRLWRLGLPRRLHEGPLRLRHLGHQPPDELHEAAAGHGGHTAGGRGGEKMQTQFPHHKFR